MTAVHKSSATAAAERRLEEVYVRWADSPEAQEILSAARAAFFATSKGARVGEAAMKAALQQLEPRYRSERPFILKSKEELLEVFEKRSEVQPLIADLLTAQQEDRQRTAQRSREAEQLPSTAPSLPPPLRAEKRAAKRARKQQLNERRAEEAKARDEHRLNWLAQHGRKSGWA